MILWIQAAKKTIWDQNLLGCQEPIWHESSVAFDLWCFRMSVSVWFRSLVMHIMHLTLYPEYFMSTSHRETTTFLLSSAFRICHRIHLTEHPHSEKQNKKMMHEFWCIMGMAKASERFVGRNQNKFDFKANIEWWMLAAIWSCRK